MSESHHDRHAEEVIGPVCGQGSGLRSDPRRGRVSRSFGDAEARHSLALACFIFLIPFGLPAIFIGMRGGGAGAFVLGAWLILAVASVIVCARALREVRRRERSRVCPNCGYPRENPHDVDEPARLGNTCPECGAEYA